MCLDKVDSEIKVARKTGYKVVVATPTGLVNKYSYVGSVEFPIGEWLEDKQTRNICVSRGKQRGQKYPTGFHLLTDKRKALLYCQPHEPYNEQVRRCSFENVVATGTQVDGDHNSNFMTFKVIVARKIKIGEEVK